jgi:hypothetical protein
LPAAPGALTNHHASITDAATRQETLRNNRPSENLDLRSVATIPTEKLAADCCSG